ncbi:MAG: tetratricopeptide repeat protein [Bdellovibrionales bacterium]|nr:tetratricopeptide repeat protein [Bdellovibrionales bacterium]
MFTTNETCTRCLRELSPERSQSTPKVCDHCGHVISKTETVAKKQIDRQSLYWVVGLAVGIVLGFMQVVSWGSYSLEIWTASPERKGQICMILKKLDCVEDVYQQAAFSDVDAMARLGRFQFNRMKYAEAAATLQTFFQRSEEPDMDTRYVYARALSEMGNVDEASTQFDLILAAKPDVLQVTVAQAYVKLLIQHGRIEQAHKVLTSIRKRGENVASFMESEFKDLSQKLGKNS